MKDQFPGRKAWESGNEFSGSGDGVRGQRTERPAWRPRFCLLMGGMQKTGQAAVAKGVDYGDREWIELCKPEGGHQNVVGGS